MNNNIENMKTTFFSTIIMALMMWMPCTQAAAQTDDTYNAQQETKHRVTTLSYCLSHDDFVAGRWTQLDSVLVVTKSRSKQMWWGGKDFKFDSDNKATRKLLKDQAFAVLYHDTLLLNTRGLKDRRAIFGKGYAHAYPMKDGRLLMLYYNVSKMSSKSAVAGMFGLVGGLAMAASTSKLAQQDVCYIVTPGEKKTAIVNAELMEQLLADHPDLLKEYQQIDKKSQLNAELVMPLLQKAGLF